MGHDHIFILLFQLDLYKAKVMKKGSESITPL